MKIDTETIITSALVSFCSEIALLIVAAIIKLSFRDNLFLFIIMPILGAVVGAWWGKRYWKKSNERPGVVSLNKLENEPPSEVLVVDSLDKIKIGEKLPDEVFMVEMLQNSIVMNKKREKGNDEFSISIDRRNIQELVISNKGKSYLSYEYIDKHSRGDHYKNRDKEIHRFLSGFDTRPSDSIQLTDDFKLRWASGGVLSVVTYRNKTWIPLFFRDIRPYGWNVALGSSERQFNERNRVIDNFNLEDELTSPSKFICREFLEETLIMGGEATSGANNSFRIIMPFEGGSKDVQKKIKFAEKHLSLRNEYDGMQIEQSRGDAINTHLIDSNMTVNIISSNGRTAESGVLVCFSLLDLGIEVVKLLKYSIPGDSCEFLDGEIIEKPNKKTELTRMPVALLSCEFLHDVFTQDITGYRYTEGINPSIEIAQSIPSDHIHIFKWDVMKRLEIVKGTKKAIESEKQRYTAWYDKFGGNFLLDSKNNISTISTKKPSKLFTPATAKLLNLFFRNAPDSAWK